MTAATTAAARLTVYLLFTLVCLPAQVAAVALHSPARATIPVGYHRRCLKMLGIKVEVAGQPTPASPCLFVSNHCSYLDIPVLGSLIPGCFVAKTEVAKWPWFGWLAKLQRSLFIDRRMSRIGDGQTALAERLRAGENLILFPEGTSSDGLRVLPFRRALFQTVLEQANGEGLTVQPVTIACVGVNGMPADRSDRQIYAWFGDMALVPHLWRFAGLRSCTVRVTFHPPIESRDISDRKELAATVERIVAGGMSNRVAA